MKRHYLIGAIVGAVAVTALGATAGVALLSDESEDAAVPEQTAEETVECRDVVVEVRQDPKDPDRVTGTVVGAIVGGVVGHQVGGGSGKDAATVAGAAAGGVAGNKIQENLQENNVRQEVQRVCNQ